MKIYSSVLACLLVIASGPTSGGAAAIPPDLTDLTLDEAIAVALSDNPELKAFEERVDSALGRAWQLGRWSNPELALAVEEWPVSGGGSFSDSKQVIGVVQELPFPGKKSLDRQLGGAGVSAAEGALALRRTALVRDVKASFCRVLAAQAAVETSVQLLSVAESSAATARKRVEAGAAAYQEQLRAEVQFEQARAEVRDLERDLVEARQMFWLLLGRPDQDDTIALSGTLTTEADSTLLKTEVSDRLANHPSAATARTSLDRARLEFRRAKLEPYPDVSVGVAGGRLGETDQSIIELGLSIPLPILDTGKGQRQEAAANVRAAEADLDAVLRDLQREWRTALERYRTAIDHVNNYQTGIVPKADEALRLVQTGFEEGKFTFIDLLDTQRTVAEARMGYQQKLLEMNIARAELEALLRPQSIETSITTHNER